jgi:microsomal dipeptidase-like Zn-dependent dipeptidase
MRTQAAPMPLQRLIDHIVHAVDIMGVDHVALGSDFDGIERGPEGLEDATAYGQLIEALLQRGFTPSEVELISGGNLRRVFADVTGVGTFASIRQHEYLEAPPAGLPAAARSSLTIR